jgi:hypothetical protein
MHEKKYFMVGENKVMSLGQLEEFFKIKDESKKPHWRETQSKSDKEYFLKKAQEKRDRKAAKRMGA